MNFGRRKLWRRFAANVAQIRGDESTYLILIASLIGLGGGLGAIGFRHLIYFFSSGFLWLASTINALATGEQVTYAILWDVPFWVKIIIPALGGMIVGPLIYFFASETKGHGVPEVMYAVALKRGVIRMRVVFAKMIISGLTLASGGSAGREGPIVQIGSAIGSSIGQLLKVSPSRMKIFVGCGAAAGIAATFNAPVAGMFFALEVILGDFAVGTLSAVAISSVVATVVARAFDGDMLALMLPQTFHLVSVWEVFTYAGLGLLAAGAAILFVKTLVTSETVWEKFHLPNWLKPALGMAMVGVIGIWFPQVFGVGYESIDLVFAGRLAMGMMAFLVVMKIIATSLTLGAGASGGIFAPSLCIGAFLGGAYGSLIHQWFPAITAPAGAYAMVAMGAVVAATTNAPITAMLILFEMTGSYMIIVPLMIACIMANTVRRLFMTESIYTSKLSRRGINIFGGREQTILQSLSVTEYMRTDHEPIPRWLPFDAVVKVMLSREESEFYVVDESNVLCGEINMHTAKDILTSQGLGGLVLADDIMYTNVARVTPETSLAEAMKLLGRRHVDQLPVVKTLDTPMFIGVIHRSDLIDAYNREILRQSALGVRYVRTEQEAQAESLNGKTSDLVELEPDQVTYEIVIGDYFVDRTLADLNIRARFGVNVIAIRRREYGLGAAIIVPDPTMPLTRGDTMVCVGTPEQIEELERVSGKPAVRK